MNTFPRFIGVIVSLIVLAPPAFAQMWSPFQTVAKENQGEFYGNPSVIVDADGAVNAFWQRSSPGGSAILHSRNLLGSWSEPEIIHSTAQPIFKLETAIAESGVMWVAWHTSFGNNLREIKTISAQDGVWSDPIPVPQPSGRRNWNPRLGAGGGRVWIVWYSELELVGGSRSDIYAATWNGSSWGDFVPLSEDLDGYHWFCDLAVDSKGRPHVVWGDGLYNYYYRTSEEGEIWSAPFDLNPLLLGVAAAGWPGCSIVVDANDHPCVAWTGSRIDFYGMLEDWDIYYSLYDGAYWTAPRQVNVNNSTTDAYPIIAVTESNLWITWQDGNPASLAASRVGVARRSVTQADGQWTTWSIEDSTFFYNSGSTVAAGPDDRVWLLWSAGHEVGSDEPDAILASYQDDTEVAVLLQGFVAVGLENSVELEWKSDPHTFAQFRVERLAGAEWQVLATLTSRGSEYSWTDPNLAAGSYSYRLAAVTRLGEEMLFGPVNALVGQAPGRLTVRVSRDSGGDYRLLVGLIASSNLSLTLFDLQGRQVHSEDAGTHSAGWQEIVWRPQLHSGRTAASGVYWLRVVAGAEQATARIVMAR